MLAIKYRLMIRVCAYRGTRTHDHKKSELRAIARGGAAAGEDVEVGRGEGKGEGGEMGRRVPSSGE